MPVASVYFCVLWLWHSKLFPVLAINVNMGSRGIAPLILNLDIWWGVLVNLTLRLLKWGTSSRGLRGLQRRSGPYGEKFN
jgi:hypothetical protein